MQKIYYARIHDQYQRSIKTFEIEPGEIVQIILLNTNTNSRKRLEFHITNNSPDSSINIDSHSPLLNLFYDPHVRLTVV
jgi:hypothetical protein